MKHDENKIEHLWEENTILVDSTDTMFYEMFFPAVKQYAEHMVEKTLIDILENGSYNDQYHHEKVLQTIRDYSKQYLKKNIEREN